MQACRTVAWGQKAPPIHGRVPTLNSAGWTRHLHNYFLGSQLVTLHAVLATCVDSFAAQCHFRRAPENSAKCPRSSYF